jgi:hypothetical protein
MNSVNFATVEDDGTDLVIGLSLEEGTEFGIDGFCIQRTPKFESFLAPHERGPSVDWTEEDVRITVKSIELNRQSIKIKTTEKKYAFDLSRINDKEYESIVTILKKMNFDNVFELNIS